MKERLFGFIDVGIHFLGQWQKLRFGIHLIHLRIEKLRLSILYWEQCRVQLGSWSKCSSLWRAHLLLGVWILWYYQLTRDHGGQRIKYIQADVHGGQCGLGSRHQAFLIFVLVSNESTTSAHIHTLVEPIQVCRRTVVVCFWWSWHQECWILWCSAWDSRHWWSDRWCCWSMYFCLEDHKESYSLDIQTYQHLERHIFQLTITFP